MKYWPAASYALCERFVSSISAEALSKINDPEACSGNLPRNGNRKPADDFFGNRLAMRTERNPRRLLLPANGNAWSERLTHRSCLGSFGERRVDELHDSPTRVKAVPRLRAGHAEDSLGERTVIFTRVFDQIHRYAHLSQSPIHFLALPKWVGGIGLPLKQEHRGFGMTCPGERALAPSIG